MRQREWFDEGREEGREEGINYTLKFMIPIAK